MKVFLVIVFVLMSVAGSERVAMAPIMEDMNNQTALVGSNVTFTCQIVMSDSQTLRQWLRHLKKNDSFVNEKGEPYVKVLQSSGFKSTIDDSQHLVLRNITKEDQGWYTCLVANTVGMNYRSAWLTVLNETEREAQKDKDYGTMSSASKMNMRLCIYLVQVIVLSKISDCF